jgi:hypothetical protein
MIQPFRKWSKGWIAELKNGSLSILAAKNWIELDMA